MIVIADTSPLNYPILVDLTQILPDLFGQVLIPQAALQELQSTSAPDIVRQCIMYSPVRRAEHYQQRLTQLKQLTL